jgi:Tfp pilus assembly protein PilF
LGIARYRAGQWKAAVEALEKSIELEHQGDAVHFFFLAMSHWQLAEQDKARKFYEQAVAWMEKNAPDHEMLIRFRLEAAELLGVSEAKATDE